MTEDKETTGDTRPSRGPEVEQIAANDLPTIYSNNVNLEITIWDFTMKFGLIREASPDKLVVGNLATVIMSPQHAKVFSQVLARNVRLYETQFGTLNVAADPEESKI